MKRFTLSMVGALAPIVTGAVQAAQFHAYAGTGDTSTATSTYQAGNTVLLGQGPVLGALVSQSQEATSGMVSGFDARSFTQGQRVRGEAGMVLLSGGLQDQAKAGMQALAHVRIGVNLAGDFLPLGGFQVTPGAAIGYTSGMTGNGGNISRVRVTPALSVSYEHDVRLTYRQSPWSYGPGQNAPRDILTHIYFMGDGMVHSVTGMGVLTIGALIPDTTNAVSDGIVVAVKTPRYRGFGVRLAYVGGIQGNAPAGPFNPSRPWDSYNRGTTLAVSYHFRKGLTVGVFEGSQSNASGSEIATQITQVAKTGHEIGLTLADRF